MALGSGACGSDEGKSVSVDGSEVEDVLTDRGFTVPALFTFTEGYEVKGFVGTASLGGAKYEGAGPLIALRPRSWKRIRNSLPCNRYPALPVLECVDSFPELAGVDQ